MISSKKVKTVLLCILMAICLTLFPVSLSMLASNNTGTATAASYSFIDVTVDKGYKATSGTTTVEGLKKNLTVTGVDDSGSYALFDDEYDITIGDGATTDDDGVITSDKGATVFNAIAKYGSLARDFQVTFAESAPVIGELTVEVNGTSITDDYTADTVYKVLTVKSGETVLTPDLYTVTMDDIYNRSTASITVTAGGKSVTLQNVSVTQARLKGVELNVADGLTLVDGRYKRDGRDVFIRGANHQAVFANLNIFAVFENGKKLLTPNFNTQGELSGVQTGESISTNLSVSATENENFTVTVTRGSSAATSNNLNINFAVTEIIAIEVNTKALEEWNNHNKLATESLGEGDRVLYPYTQLNLAEMKGNDGTPVFSLLRNDGTYDTSLSNLAVDGSLAPSAATADSNPSSYTKKISIVCSNNSNVPAIEIDIKKINFSQPNGLAIAGNLTTQIKHNELNLSGLTLELSYKLPNGRTSTVGVPLTDYVYNDYVQSQIYDDNGTNEKVLNGSNYVEINISYKTLTANKSYEFTPVNDRIPLPMTDMSTVTFADGCKKSFTNYDPGIMQLEVLDADLNTVDPALYAINGSDVEFKSGGIYNIKISLNPDENGKIKAKDGVAYPADEFVLYNEGTTSGVSISGDGHSAVYTIQINRGTLAVNIEEPAVENIYYGDKLGDLLQVTGTSNGRSTNLKALSVKYQLVFIREGSANPVNSELTYEKLTYENYTVPEKLNAGKYTVYAVTQANEAYLAGKVRENRGLELEILPKEIDSTGFTTSVEYNRNKHSVSEFMSVSNFAYGESAEDVLNTVIKKDATPVTEIKYAGDYTITATIKPNEESSGSLYNYKWVGETLQAKDIKVTVTKKEFNDFALTLTKNEYYYGEASSLSASITGSNDAYFTVDLSDPAYYQGSTLVTGQLNELDFGTYKVVYPVTAVYAADEGNTGGVPNDFVLPAAEAEFTIKKVAIEKVYFGGWQWNEEREIGSYLPDGHELTYINWTKALTAGDTSKHAYDALEFSFKYTALQDGHTLTYTPAVSNTDGTLVLKDAGTYVLTVKLNKNYEWREDTGENTTGNIVFTAKISRAALDEPALSDSVTYNGTEQTVNVTDWEEKFNGLVTYTIKGATLAAIDAGEVEHDNDGTFKVIYAGNYTLTFSLGDNVNNYGWGSNKSIDDCVKTYTVLQANLKVNWNPTFQDFNDTAEGGVQKIETEATPSGNFDDGKLAITEYKIYSDKECTNEVESVTKAGTYYLLVTQFGLKDGVTGFNPANYKLAEDGTGIKCTYEIRTQSLATPVLDGYTDNKITKTYKGAAYYITDFFVDGGKYYDNSGNNRLEVTVTGGTELKDVIISGENIGSYTVKVKPAGNYRWSDNTQTVYTYTVTIEKAELGIKWGNASFVYNGEEQKPSAEATGLKSGDEDKVTIDVSGAKKDAGNGYTATATTIGGDRGFNYKLPDDKTTTFDIATYKLGKPMLNGAGTFEYGQERTFEYSFPELNALTGYEWENIVTVAVSGQYRDGLASPVNHGAYSFDWVTDSFKATNAGYYTVVFTIQDTDNFAWQTEGSGTVNGDSYTLADIKITRKEITAPRLGQTVSGEFKSERTFVRTEQDLQPTHFSWDNDYSTAADISYGKYDKTLSNEAAYISCSEFKDVGEYYVCFTLESSQSPLNYVWKLNPVDDEDPAIKNMLVSANGFTVYSENKVCVYLNYAITGTVLDIVYETEGYTYGENNGLNINNKITSNIVEAIADHNGDKTYKQVITFKKNDETIGVVTIAADGTISSTGEWLENYLPWNAGKYDVGIVLTFTDENLQERQFKLTLTVAQKEITPDDIEWTDSNSSEVYDGNAHSFTVAFKDNFAPERSNGYKDIPTFEVGWKDGVTEAKNAGNYTAVVLGVGSDNYTFTEGKLTESLHIGQRSVVIALSQTALKGVYATELSFAGVEWTNTDHNFIETDYKGFVGYKLYKDGAEATGKLDAGDYEIMPYLKNNDGNYILADSDITAGNFTIEKRKINITSVNSSVVYAATENADISGTYSVEWENKPDGMTDSQWLVSGDSVFTVSSDAANSFADVGKYDVKITLASNINNYTVKIGGNIVAEGEHVFEKIFEITPAQITNATATGYTDIYDGEAHEAIKNYSANAVNNQPLTWWVAKVGTEAYEKVNTAEGKVTNVSQSGTYKVKVTAPNHAEKILDDTDDTVTVEIKQVEVTISVNINIFYGETGPEAHGTEEGKWFKQSFDELKKGGIYSIVDFVNDTDRAAFAAGTLSGLGGQETFSYRYADGVTYASGSKIGDYKLIFNCGDLASENYSFVGGESWLHVLALPVKVTLQDLTAKYNQAEPPAVDTAVGNITTAQTSNYDGKPITVYGTQADILTVATDALTSSTGKTTNVVDDYSITAGLKLTDDKTNYTLTDDSKVTAVYSITKTENGLTDNYGLFTVAKSYKELAANSENAWIYGVYTDGQTDGYNAAGDQEAVEATFVYDENGAHAEYTLYNADSQSPIMTKTVLAELFGGGLDAGDYRVQITFPAGDNYEVVDESLYFRIGKRGLTVTAAAQKIQYGENAPEYTYAVSGYANGENEEVFGKNKPVFKSVYVIGNDAGTYNIVSESGAKSLDNYTVAYTGNTLTVSQREVTIVIEHKESEYSFYGENGAKELTSRIKSGSIYAEQNVYSLGTNVDKESPVGDYPIYAVYNSEEYQQNYKITVVADGNDRLYDEEFTADGLLIGGGGAGTAGVYTVTAAKLSLSLSKIQWFDGSYHSYADGVNPNIYDGRMKGIVATAKDDKLGKTFTAKYRKNGSGEYIDELPKDVGNYDYIFVSNDPNYSYDTSGLELGFEIYPAALTISFGTNTVNDGWTHSETYKNADYELDFNFGGLVNASSEGVENTDEIALTTPQIVTAYPDGVDITKFASGFAPFSTMSGTVDAANEKFTLTARNAGRYTVTLTLDGSDLMKNYHFGTSYATKSITFTFTILQKDLSVNSVKATVEYGTAIEADGTKGNRFSGFGLTEDVKNIVQQENSFESNVRYFITDNVTYSTLRDGKPYSANDTQNGFVYRITPAGAVAYNYKLSYGNAGELEVVQRNITIKLKGIEDNNNLAQAEYDGTVKSPSTIINNENVSNFLEYVNSYPEDSNSENWYGGATNDAGKILNICDIILSIDNNAVDAGLYDMSINQGNTAADYKITFEHYSSQESQFRINQRNLTIQAVGEKTGNKAFSITYGDTVDGYFGVRYSGFIEKDGNETGYFKTVAVEGELVYSASSSMKKYAAWESHADEVYIVEVEGLTFKNYKTNYLPATMTVVSRKITAQTQNRTYTEIEENGVKIYNGGASGIYHIAPVTFKDIVSGITYTVAYKDNGGIVTGGTITVNYGDGKTALSNTTFALKYQNSVTVAPVKAGENQVTITLTGKDFVFDTVNTTGTANNSVIGTVSETSATFEYDVEKQALDFARDPVTDETTFFKWEAVDAGVKHVDISDYVGDIMEIVTVQRISGKTTETFGTTVSSKGGYYAVGDNKLNLYVYPNGVGIYVVTVRLNGTADENYVWKNGNQEATVQFTFASEKLTITSLSIKEKGWTYLGYDSTKNAITITNDVNVDESAFAFTYAEYTGSIPEGQELGVLVTTLDSKLPDNSTFGQVLGGLSYRALLPTDAGTYVLKAEYRGETYGTAVGYCLFTITPKAVKAPVLDGENVSYDMNEHTAAVTYDSNALGYTYATLNGNGNGIVSPSSNKVTVTATNADTYILTFTITDTKNYVWAENAGAENGAVRREWTIAKATDNEVTVKAISIGYGEQFEVTATSKYGGEFTYSYAVRGNEASPLANAQWHDGKPVNAGKYWIKAVCGETANFTQSTGSGELTINKATLTATPEGHMTYGDSFSSAVKEIKYTGWKNGELEVTGNVSYEIIGYNKESLLNVLEGGYQMTVNGVLTVTEGHDDVFGFDIDNYDIQTRTGVFTVNKLAVEVTIDNLTITYGEAFNPSDVKLTDASVAKLVGADREAPFAALNITPTVLGSMTNGYYIASAYVLSSTGHENSVNYEVSVRTGIFTVKALDVYITVDAGGGEYGDVTPAAVTHVYTGDGIDVEEKFGNLAPSFGFLYSGTANDGTVITNSSTAPALAGNYTAVARVTQFIGNYNLVTDRGTPSVTFIVSRKTITESDISVEEIKFNNEDQSPVIIDEKYSDLYTAEEVAFREVGGYTVTLTLKDADNYKWSSVEGGEYSLPFSIERGDNEFTSDIIIRDWNFGDSANTPETETVYGDSADYIFTYSTSEDGEYTRTVPTAAGTYWVKVTVPQSENYNEKTSDPVKFTIGKRAVKAPALETVAEGDNANTTYTGGRLQSAVKDYDPVIMRIIYEGDLSSAGSLAVYAVNAGEYKVYFALNDEANYTWAEGTALSENNAVLVWNVARKKIAKPEMDTSLYMVNGGTLTFMPEGFDESTMAIAGNTTSYGGVFKVTVSIKDTVNFEWADGSVEDITFDWIVVGWDTVFIIVVSVLGVVAGIAAIAIGIQYLVHRRKKSAAAASEAAAEAAFHESVAAMAEGGDVPPDDGGTPEQPAEEEEPSFNEPAEEKPEQGEENTQTEEVKEEATENTEAPDAENNQTEEGGNEDE